MSRKLGDRAVSTIIGAVLLFAIIIMAMTAYQVEVVPENNKQVEYRHNQDVQRDLQAVRDGIITAGASGTTQSVSVSLGTTYKPRTFFVNPSPPVGHLETVGTTNPAVAVTVENVTAIDREVADYWSGTQEFSTGSLTYTPNYHQYKAAPTTAYENTVVYNSFDGVSLGLSDQALVEGTRINLVTLDGTVDIGSSGEKTFTVRPVSASSNTISIRGNGSGPLTVTIPTQLPNTAPQGTSWSTLLDEQIASGHVQSTSIRDGPGEFKLVTIALDPKETYSLHMAKVGIGGNLTDPRAHYITVLDRPRNGVEAGTTHTITVDVRDRYNNPIDGFPVNATASEGDFNSSPVRTDAGEATFTYTAPDIETNATLNLSIYNGTTAERKVEFTLNVTTAASGGGDQTGPNVSNVSTNVSTVKSGDRFNLNATITDTRYGGSDIIAAVWWSNRSPPNGGPKTAGFTMIPADGLFDQPTEIVENTSIDTAGWSDGTHTLSVQGQDGNGNWGDPTNVTLNVEGLKFTSLTITNTSDDPPPKKAGFEINYSTNFEYDNVTAVFTNLDTPNTKTKTDQYSGDTFGSIEFTGESQTKGDTYEITVKLYDTNGNLVASETFTKG